jgi:hypothetical protein
MIDIMSLKPDLHPKLASLIGQFRRIQVSKFPLIADQRSSTFIRFMDSRFNADNSERVGSLRLDSDDDKDVYVISSPTIVNSRYKGARKNEKQTKDPAKALKYLQSFIRPFTPQRIASYSFSNVDRKFDHWRWDIEKQAGSIMRLNMHQVYEEIKRMRELGLKAQTADFQRAMDEGLEKYEHMKATANRKIEELMHVFFNPDESADIHMHKPYEGIAASYASINEMPYDLASRISMLRIGEVDSYVPNVGIRTDDRTFWVDLVG